MDELQFRLWLETRRWLGKPLSPKGIKNRIRRLRRVTRSLRSLGYASDDLDKLISDQAFEGLLNTIRTFILQAPSRAGLPDTLVPQATDPRGQLKNILAVLRLYFQFAHERDGPGSGEQSRLERLREIFLQRCPDFVDFQQNEGTYWEIERKYKDIVVQKVRSLIESDKPAPELGRALYEAMTPNQGPLLRWQTREDFDTKHTELAAEFFTILAAAARDSGPADEVVWRTAEQLQALRDRGADKLTPGEIGALAFTTVGCSDPSKSAPFKITKAQSFAKAAIENPIFQSGPVQRPQVERWLTLLREVQQVLAEWGWKPRDLFDVQGFAWVALDEKWGDETDDEEEGELELGPYWFVGSSFGGTSDQTQRFLAEGIWEIDNPSDTDAAQVRSMEVGQRIAMKAAFVQRLGLPFENRGVSVSAMRIKGRGTITENSGDGARLSVEWDTDFEQRDWYFYTNRRTIWQQSPGTPYADALIRFTFLDQSQDYDLFLSDDYWAGMYGAERADASPRFWIEKTLVSTRPDRLEGEHALGRALWSPQKSKDGRDIYKSMLQVREGDVVFHLTDNKAISDVAIVAEAADNTFNGVEGTDWANQEGYRIALRDHAKLDPPLSREALFATEPFATELKELATSGAKGMFYSKLLELNQGAYLTEVTPSLLSILNRAYREHAGKNLPYVDGEPDVEVTADAERYTLEDALETLFIEREAVEEILLLWRAKKNLIIQGPPGVGKSYAAQRLAFALMGAKDRSRLKFVQFHQSYSYEDFVEGFRPTASGFELRPGKFVEFCRQAEADPDRIYVFIIDEINRGNLSKIMGELMVLIESDKRDPDWAMPLASGKAPFHVPANVFILGLMNTADRSLAVVDYALRRRFAFVDLGANLSSPKFRVQLLSVGVSDGLITALIDRVSALNTEIVGDIANLGPGFAIGHSFFCAGPVGGELETDWYGRVIKTEIAPLLREYWFDAQSKAEHWSQQLLAIP